MPSSRALKRELLKRNAAEIDAATRLPIIDLEAMPFSAVTRNGIEYQPDYYRELVQLEIDSGFSFRPGMWLGDLRPDLLTETQRQNFAVVQARAVDNKRSKSTIPLVTKTRPYRPIQLPLL